jgi:peptidoglycan/xylan/chitin deacetylase (PgdA/CDA1 family)
MSEAAPILAPPSGEIISGFSPGVLFVNYHHVCSDEDLIYSRLHHRTPEQFRDQIEVLTKTFDFPSIEEVERMLETRNFPRRPVCVLTFDDGLSDHITHVHPILTTYGIVGIFSIATDPWTTGRLLSVHRAHLLAAAFSYVSIASDLVAAAVAHGFERGIDSVEPDVARSQYRYDDVETARVKYYLNAVIPQEMRATILEAVFSSRLGDDAPFVARHYITPDGVRALRAAGHAIGLHTHSHLHLASSPAALRERDLNLNLQALQPLAGSVNWISYPYGGPTSYDEATIAAARCCGCRFGLTMHRGYNKPETLDSMRLSRIDSNDAPGGKLPLAARILSDG